MAAKAKPATNRAAPATEPDERLLALEGELCRQVLELELMHLRRVLPANGNTWHEIEARRVRISELHDAIAGIKPTTLAGAAVLLRRVPAMLGDDRNADPSHLALASRLIDSALAVIEKNAV